MMLDCSQLSYTQMADIARALATEVAKRSPEYKVVSLSRAAESLDELADLEESE